MHWRINGLAVLIAFIAAGHAGAETGGTLHPCSFLTPEQISAAVGKVGKSAEGDMPGKARMRACSWSISGGVFTLSVGKVPNPNQSARQLLDYMNSMYDQLKAQGWKYEKKDFGSTSCSVVTPPSGAANASPATFCATVVKGMLVVASASSKASIPAEKLKSLAETAAARLR
jgi:hypothetical protein